MSKYYVLLGPKTRKRKPELTLNKTDFVKLVGEYFDKYPDGWVGIFPYRTGLFNTKLIGAKYFKKDIYNDKGKIIYNGDLGYTYDHFSGPNLRYYMECDKPAIKQKKQSRELVLTNLLKRKASEVNHFIILMSKELNKSRKELETDFMKYFEEMKQREEK